MHSLHLPSLLRHAGCALVLLLATAVQAAPTISNLSAEQRPGTKLVDIRYDLDGGGFATLAVRLQVSSNAGSTWTVPATTVSGAIGNNVTPGTGRVIVWNAGADWPGGYSTQMRFRVIADDQVVPVEGFSFIPAGSFIMGRTSGDTDADAPPITVTVSGFYIQQTETTRARWNEVRSWGFNNGYTDLPLGQGKSETHPVFELNWYDVVKWCNARSEKEGLTPVYRVGGSVMRTGQAEPTADWSANGYRLPTEAEWEKAARGGVSDKRFPWGADTISHAQANYANWGGESYAVGTTNFHASYSDYAWGSATNTSPVGSFAANGYGLYDIAGNVQEWCWDWYDANYYTTSNGAIDPRGPPAGDRKVIRGGSWVTTAQHARTANRSSDNMWGRQTGFRPVRSAVP